MKLNQNIPVQNDNEIENIKNEFYFGLNSLSAHLNQNMTCNDNLQNENSFLNLRLKNQEMKIDEFESCIQSFNDKLVLYEKQCNMLRQNLQNEKSEKKNSLNKKNALYSQNLKDIKSQLDFMENDYTQKLNSKELEIDELRQQRKKLINQNSELSKKISFLNENILNENKKLKEYLQQLLNEKEMLLNEKEISSKKILKYENFINHQAGVMEENEIAKKSKLIENKYVEEISELRRMIVFKDDQIKENENYSKNIIIKLQKENQILQDKIQIFSEKK